MVHAERNGRTRVVDGVTTNANGVALRQNEGVGERATTVVVAAHRLGLSPTFMGCCCERVLVCCYDVVVDDDDDYERNINYKFT